MPVAWIELELLTLPGVVHAVGDIITVYNINDISSILKLEHLWVMSRADSILYFVRAGRYVGNGMNHDRSAPLGVPSWRIFAPATDKKMVLSVRTHECISPRYGHSLSS